VKSLYVVPGQRGGVVSVWQWVVCGLVVLGLVLGVVLIGFAYDADNKLFAFRLAEQDGMFAACMAAKSQAAKDNPNRKPFDLSAETQFIDSMIFVHAAERARDAYERLERMRRLPLVGWMYR